MKKIIYILLGACLIIASCKEHGPRNHEEIREDAIEFVRDFIKDVYKGKNVSNKCVQTLDFFRMDEKISQEFDLPYRLPDIIKATSVKIDPKDISFCKDVEENWDKGKLENVIVRVKNRGKEMKFCVHFSSIGNTGTEGKPLMYYTVGFVGFDNLSFSKKSGFVLEYDKSQLDLAPYILYTEAVIAQRYVAKQNHVLPDKVIIPKDIKENADPIWKVFCGDSIVYQVHLTRKNNTNNLYDTYTPKILNVIKLK